MTSLIQMIFSILFTRNNILFITVRQKPPFTFETNDLVFSKHLNFSFPPTSEATLRRNLVFFLRKALIESTTLLFSCIAYNDQKGQDFFPYGKII